jgi:hypothetical protein
MQDGRDLCLDQLGGTQHAAFLDVVVIVDVHRKLSATEAL